MVDLTLSGALLTAIGSIFAGGVTGFLTARIKNRQDLEAWDRARGALLSDTSAALLRDTVSAIATAGHAACWLTWRAEFDPGSLTEKSTQDYDWTMHEQLPKMFGGQAAIATLCPEAGEIVLQAVDIISTEDVGISMACVAYRRGDLQPLAARHSSAVVASDRARKLCAGLGAQLVRGMVR